MFRIFTDNNDASFAARHLTVSANFFCGCANFHNVVYARNCETSSIDVDDVVKNDTPLVPWSGRTD